MKMTTRKESLIRYYLKKKEILDHEYSKSPKTCKTCSKILSREKAKAGNIFCDNYCSAEFKKKVKQKSCLCCNNLYVYTTRTIFCSKICEGMYKRAMQDNKEYDILRSSTAPKCVQCSKPLSYRGIVNRHRFCSQSCSSSYNIVYNSQARIHHRSDIREKIYTKSVKTKQMQVDERRRIYLKSPCLCPECNTIIKYEKSKTRKYCSKQCANIGSSRKLKEKFNSREYKEWWKTCRSNRSKSEKRLYDLCQSGIDADVLANFFIYEKWDSDIAIPEFKIAIAWNGPWHYKQISEKFNHSWKQTRWRDRQKRKLFRELGWKVLIFEDRHWTPEAAFDAIVGLISSLQKS